MARASNEIGVVDDGNFWRFRWLVAIRLRKLQRYGKQYCDDNDMLPVIGAMNWLHFLAPVSHIYVCRNVTSKTFRPIGGAVGREFESEAPATEEMLH